MTPYERLDTFEDDTIMIFNNGQVRLDINDVICISLRPCEVEWLIEALQEASRGKE